MAFDQFMLGVAAFLATYLIHSTLVFGAVMLACRLTGPGSATREALFRAALLAPLATTLIAVNLSPSPWTARVGWQETREVVREVESPAPVASPSPPLASAGATGAGNQPRRVPELVESPAAPSVDPQIADEGLVDSLSVRAAPALVAAAWMLVALWLGARWVRGARAGRRLLARRTQLRKGPAHAALVKLAGRAGVAVPRLSLSRDIAGPATLPTREICLPAWALDLPPALLEAMLAHELAHVERRDPWWLAVAVTVEALFWMQPLNRLARRRLASLAELHADARGVALTRDGRALARCLAACAERMSDAPMPVLAAAMARQRMALSERVGKLISGSMETGGLSMSKKFLIFSGALALVLVMPSVAVMANKASDGVSTSISINKDDSSGWNSMHLQHSGDGYRLELRSEGDIVFASDDSGIERMAPGASLALKHEADGVERKLVARGGDDSIDYSYRVDGEERPFQPEGRAWFAEVLPMILRESAINAPERVAHILATGGHDAVLEEIGLIRSDHARRAYIEAYAASGELPDSAWNGLMAEAGKLGSDFEQSRALMSIYGHQKPRGDRLAALIVTADGIKSDFEMRRFLEALTDDAVDDEQVMAAYAEAASSIGSDFELRQALESLVEAGNSPAAVQLALPVARDIGSDFEMRQFLEASVRHVAGDESLARSWLEAAGSIGSDFELRQALESLADKDPASPSVWVALLETAGGIGSDHECSSLLIRVAGRMPDDPAVREAFDAALATIGSEHEHDRVARAAGR